MAAAILGFVDCVVVSETAVILGEKKYASTLSEFAIKIERQQTQEKGCY